MLIISRVSDNITAVLDLVMTCVSTLCLDMRASKDCYILILKLVTQEFTVEPTCVLAKHVLRISLQQLITRVKRYYWTDTYMFEWSSWVVVNV